MSKGNPAVPPHFACPISLQLMLDPVTLCTGVTYDRPSIQRWLAGAATPSAKTASISGNGSSTNGLTPFCPSTMQPLWDTALTPNLTLRRLIHSWCAANNIDPFASPSGLVLSGALPSLDPLSTPLDSLAADELVESVEHAATAAICSRQENCTAGIELATLDALHKLRSSAEANMANRERLASAGARKTLSYLMSSRSFPASTAVFDEVLTTLALLLPSATSGASSTSTSSSTTATTTATTTTTSVSLLSEDEISELSPLTSTTSLQRLANCLHEGSLCVKASVAFVLDCLVNSKQAAVTSTVMSSNVLLISGLIGLLRRKSSMRRSVHLSTLNILIAVLCSHGRKRGRLIAIESGVIEALLDLLPEAQTRSLCERTLAVLELVISCPEGREAAADNDLLIPALVHKICGVSSTATMCAIGALLKMCRRSPCYEKLCREAVQAGAIPKVFLLLQVGSRSTMDRANELLRQLRRHSDCNSSVDRLA